MTLPTFMELLAQGKTIKLLHFSQYRLETLYPLFLLKKQYDNLVSTELFLNLKRRNYHLVNIIIAKIWNRNEINAGYVEYILSANYNQ